MEHLIKPEWFEPMPTIALLAIGAIALWAVIKGADWLVEGASGMALRAGMSKVIIGATIVSLGTTSPEAAVSVMAAWSGNPGLALGNAVGSIIADTGLIFGLGCLLMALPVDRFIVSRQGWVQFGAAVFMGAVCYIIWIFQGDNATLDRWFGFVLLVMLAWYLWVSVRWGKQHATLMEQRHEQAQDTTTAIIAHAQEDSWPKLIGFFVLGLAMVIIFAHILIICVQLMAQRWGVPQVVIASTIVALGTSLPELVVGITAIRKGHAELLIGNVIGADILNVLFVVGASAAAAPLPIIEAEIGGQPTAVPEIFLYLHLPTMLLILGLFRVFIHGAIKHGRFRRWYGVPLVGIYVGYLVANVVLSR